MTKPRWDYYATRRFNYFVEWTQMQCAKPSTQRRAFGFAFPLTQCLILNGDEYFVPEDAEAFEKILETKSSGDPAFFRKLIQMEYEKVRDAKTMERVLRSQSLSIKKMGTKELRGMFQAFLHVYIPCFATAYVRPDDFVEKKVRTLLQRHLEQKKRLTDVKEVLSGIAAYPSAGVGKLDYIQEPLDLLRVAVAVQKAKKNQSRTVMVKRLLVKHLERYSWLKNPNLYENVSISQEELETRLKELVRQNIQQKIRHIEKVHHGNERYYRYLRQRHTFPSDLQRWVALLREFIFLRTYTTEAADRLFYWARQTLFREVARRYHLSEQDIVSMTGDEIDRMLRLNRKVPAKTLRDRRMAFAAVWQHGKATLYAGKSAKRIIARYSSMVRKTQSRQLNSELHGSTAHPGKVRGRVRVLHSYKEVGTLRRGDILVVSMTTPDYIMAMERAAAFVTDEGGITCHAAIIAREMDKPCVIGVRTATRVLKTGDLVEVDAAHGVVKILRKVKE